MKCSSEPTDKPVSQCSACKAFITDPDAVIDAVRIGQEALDKATHLQSSGMVLLIHFIHPIHGLNHLVDDAKARQLTAHMIPILISAGLPPSCHPLLALFKLHQSLLVASFSERISQESLDESIRTAAKHVAGVSALLDEGHPVRGVSLAELGKLLAVDEPSPSLPSQMTSFPPSGPTRLKVAYETLLKARNELLVGFGWENEGGEVGREVRENIVALEKELGVWATGVRNVLEDMPARTGGKT
ncbi:hypothetical protein JVU11DRAFT_8030 [Chiua virens]|nr:hypothetical protein JVU11DRAFT_8030 [Chiua virens]